MNDKVEIIIEEGHTYNYKDRLGQPFTSVSYMGKNYGGGSPCNNEEEIKTAVKYAKKTIVEAGDKPIVVDKREKAKLTKWL